MSTDVDPLDEGMPRDWQHRPLIIPAPRGKPNLKAKLATYTRASTFAKALDDGGGLTKWKVRHAASGIAHSRDLAAMVVALGRNPDTFEREDKAALDAIIDRAHDRSGGSIKADYGTAVHSVTEPGRDFDPLALDAAAPGIMRDVCAYELLLEALDVDVIATETFVVNDELTTGGTFDHMVRLRSDLTIGEGDAAVTIPAGTVLVVDKKTGSLHLGQHAIQLAIYARGKTYNRVTGERGALEVSPQWGIVAHVPRGEGKAVAYVVDLHAGWKAAKLALEVRAYRSATRKLGTVVATVEAPADDATPLAETIADAGFTAEEAVAIVTIPKVTDPAVDTAEQVAADKARYDAALERARQQARTLDDGTDAGGNIVPPETLAAALLTETEAVENVIAVLGDGVLDEITRATTRDQCADLWRKYTAAGAWRDEHTAAVQARLAELPAA